MQTQDMDLALSTDAKPRLKWTAVLHQRFVEAVAQLGGADKATPKNLMRVMGVPGLTLYHLKSHLQKYRLGKNQELEVGNDSDHEGYTEVDYRVREVETGHNNVKNMMSMGRTQIQNDESLQITQALQMQMEVQERLHKQIEVQRHLQLRIEAQGKYLQSILTKAQETLSVYSPTAKSEVSEFVPLVDSRHLNFSGPGDLLLSAIGKASMRDADCSLDSSLTSSESYGRQPDNVKNLQTEETTCRVLQLMDTNPSLSYQLSGRKRSGSTISDESSVEQPLPKRSLGLTDEFDMNRKYQSGASSGRVEGLDLNSDVHDESLKLFGA